MRTLLQFYPLRSALGWFVEAPLGRNKDWSDSALGMVAPHPGPLPKFKFLQKSVRLWGEGEIIGCTDALDKPFGVNLSGGCRMASREV